MADHIINTQRLYLRPWAEKHREPFARLHGDPQVMVDMGGPLDTTSANAKFDGYAQAYRTHGHGRWAVEDLEGRFLGYAGVMARTNDPLGFHREIG
ncbi:MAG: GNAT family N-acetyltransferase, partial [Pseudomonadota bacterium]